MRSINCMRSLVQRVLKPWYIRHVGALVTALAALSVAAMPATALAQVSNIYNPYAYSGSYYYYTPTYDYSYSTSTAYNIAYANVSIPNDTYTYTGSEIKPTVTVSVSGSYSNDFYSWMLYGDNYWYYDGYTWYIDVDDDNVHTDSYTVYYDSSTNSYYYTRFGTVYWVSIPYSYYSTYSSSSSYKLTEGSEYYVTYVNNVNVGTATITVRGISPFYGSKEITFAISSNSSKATRLSGATRYDTMSSIVSCAFSPKVTYAVVACGNNFPDALAASSLAGAYGAPIILTDSNGLASQAQSQLSRLGVTSVFLMGGTSAISSNVETQIRNMGINVTRISGTDRIGTSIATLNATKAANPSNVSNTVIIATGYNFADSLSIGPWSYAFRTPIILTQADGTLSSAAVSAIQSDTTKTRIIIVGGTAAVSETVRSQLGSSYSYTRLSGATRYETSTAIAEWEVQNGLNWQHPSIATGDNFPDALSGAALAGTYRSPVLLVSSTNSSATSLMSSNRSSISGFYVLGGENAVPTTIVNNISNAIK